MYIFKSTFLSFLPPPFRSFTPFRDENISLYSRRWASIERSKEWKEEEKGLQKWFPKPPALTLILVSEEIATFPFRFPLFSSASQPIASTGTFSHVKRFQGSKLKQRREGTLCLDRVKMLAGCLYSRAVRLPSFFFFFFLGVCSIFTRSLDKRTSPPSPSSYLLFQNFAWAFLRTFGACYRSYPSPPPLSRPKKNDVLTFFSSDVSMVSLLSAALFPLSWTPPSSH